MLKYVLIALVLAWLFYSPALRGLRSRLQDKDTDKPTAQPPKTPRHEDMVRCAHCGLHLPQSEALTDDAGQHYCGAAHRQAGPRPA